MMGFDGTEVNPHIRTLIEEYRLGTILLNAKNFTSAEQGLRLIRDLQIIAHRSGHEQPLLIALDQENGLVNSITDELYITQFPSSMAIAATNSKENAYLVGHATARELSAIGVNWLLGPALDVILDSTVPGFGTRSFGDDPHLVAKLGSNFIRGCRDAHVACCAKHFPLGGSLEIDESVAKVPVISTSLEQLRQSIIVPFEQAIRDGVDGIAAAGCAISSMGPKLMHACLSKKVLTELLRGQLGYEGVIVSECLEMDGIAQSVGVGQATVMGLGAGCDMINVCRSFPMQLEAFASLSLALENKTVPASRVEEKASRISSMKNKYTNWQQALHPLGLQHLESLRAEHRQLALRVYEQSMTILQDDPPVIPLTQTLPTRSKVVLFTPLLRVGQTQSSLSHGTRGRSLTLQTRNFASGSMYGEEYFQAFGQALSRCGVGEVVHTSYSSHGVQIEHERLLEDADLVIIMVADANRNQYQAAFARYVNFLCRLRERGQKVVKGPPAVVLLSLSSPYDLPIGSWRGTHLAIYDCTAISLSCVLRVLCGNLKAEGRAPGYTMPKRVQSREDHQPTWLVEQFDPTRDLASLYVFLKAAAESESEGSPAEKLSLWLSGLSPDAFSNAPNSTMATYYFIVRNASTETIYGLCRMHHFKSVNHSCLDFILVEASKRRLSIGTDLYNFTLSFLRDRLEANTVQVGCPLFGIYPGLLKSSTPANDYAKKWLENL
ncbi:hypothetical protein PV04_08748 [Phialophora macrospora]|uniref:Glycoside hydrolase family 3 N-terminal domain-containing protein n=1 Tax=Phialophora macrospora TaxID=1851006 RepID=A0A0D2FA18_9EURO|nr:hypothetical protein PV04_08748 [Phialophora macrospora]